MAGDRRSLTGLPTRGWRVTGREGSGLGPSGSGARGAGMVPGAGPGSRRAGGWGTVVETEQHPSDRGVISMSNHTYRVTEIVGTSHEGLDAAIRNGISRAAQTVRNLDWFEVKEVRGQIEDGKVEHYQVGLKVGFRLEEPGE